MKHRAPLTGLRSKLLSTLGFALVLGACASTVTSDAYSESATLWSEMKGYRGWAQFSGHAGIQKSKSRMHGKYVATYINAVAAANPEQLGFGSILVKDNFAKDDPATLEGITVMKRIEGFDPENGDWFWARYSVNGAMTHAGQVSMCSNCHLDADGADFVFLND